MVWQLRQLSEQFPERLQLQILILLFWLRAILFDEIA
jgi:hypothetical protein